MTDEEFNDWKWEQERLSGLFRARTEAFRPSQSVNRLTASSMRDEDFPEDYFGCGDDR